MHSAKLHAKYENVPTYNFSIFPYAGRTILNVIERHLKGFEPQFISSLTAHLTEKVNLSRNQIKDIPKGACSDANFLNFIFYFLITCRIGHEGHNNHTSRSLFGGTGNISSMGLQYREKCR